MVYAIEEQELRVRKRLEVKSRRFERGILFRWMVRDDGDGRRAVRGRRAAWHMFAWLPAALLGAAAWCAEELHTVPYVPSASSEGHAGVVRIESRSSRSGEVRVVAVDDAGQRVEAGRLTLGAGAAVEFEMAALESGDALLGLEGTGPGEGDWRLELSTDLDIEARAYARSEGFATALHDAALLSGEVELPFFNPGGDARRSVLRLANARGEPAAVSVRGVDDAGRAAGPVTAELGPWEARSYTAPELESGSAAGLTGSLGDGAGKWRLFLEAERGSAYATNLLLDGSGVLSSVPGGMSRGGFHRVPLFPSASDGEGRRGLVRVVNRSADSAEVSIDAFDATDRAYERLELTLAGEASGQFDSSDLEQGNAEKGLEGSTGPGEGDWWLELSSASDIELVSYVDTASGPLSALRGTAGVETESGMRYEALLWGESGEVRLLNAGGGAVAVRLSGTDDAGSSGGAVELTLAPWSARTLTATALAEGEAGMLGALGAGSGSWRLRLEADREIDVLSLVRGSGGMLSDVSRRGRPAGAPPRTDVIDATARGRPDLWVAASASEAELSPGEAFELTATVGNRGGDASATTLRYYRSADASITAGDAEVGADAVAELAAGATSAGSLTLNAPTAAGTYYYGACADAVAEETNTANNCSTGVAVTVREPPAQPDLEVRASLSAGAVRPGEAFELLATVRNRGGAQAQATTLRYYRSTDATITTSDTEEGTDAVDELAASDSSAESIALTAPSTSGIYYYGACVDAVPDEYDTTNNCSSSVEIQVAVPVTHPNLAVVSPSVSDARPDPGVTFTFSATVRNLGDSASASSTLRYYRSSDATVSGADTQVATDPVTSLGTAGSSPESATLTAPSTSGIYYYGACVDAVPDEYDTTNNCSSSVEIQVAVPVTHPNLAVVSPSVSDARPDPGVTFTFSATVRNLGDSASASSTLRYYRSSDATVSGADTQVATDPVTSLGTAGSSPESATLTAPSTSGIYYYGACVDAVPDEYDTTNNCSSSVEIQVAVPVTHPNLAVVSPSVSDARPDPGVTFTFSATVRNLGDSASASSTLRYYRSSDATVSGADTQVATDPVTSLGTAGSSPESATLMAPSTSGTYYYGACVDPVEGESDTADNCSEAVEVTVLAVPPGPDLVVSASTDHPVVGIGVDILVEAEVRNRGGADASKTLLLWFLSDNETRMGWSGFEASARVPSLEVGRSATLEHSFAALRRPGTYYFIACAEAVPDESDTSNNCSAAEVTIRSLAPPPDLTVTVAGAWDGDGALTLTVTNVGTGRSAGTMLGIYCTVDLGEPHPGQELRWGPIQTVPPLEPGESMIFERKDVSVPHELYAWVQPVVGEMDIDNNVSDVFRQ